MYIKQCIKRYEVPNNSISLKINEIDTSICENYWNEIMETVKDFMFDNYNKTAGYLISNCLSLLETNWYYGMDKESHQMFCVQYNFSTVP